MKKKIFIGVIVCLCFGFGNYLLPVLNFNESCQAFSAPSQAPGMATVQSDDPCETTGTGASGTTAVMSRRPTLGFLIASAGGYFLKSGGEFLSFASLYELSELSTPDYKAMTSHLTAAVEEMEKANRAYYQLSAMSRDIPYNQAVINRLAEFDYTGFQATRGLIPSIFSDVQAYLSTGDVRGAYAEYHRRAGAILEKLIEMKETVEAGSLPEVSAVWRLNQAFAENKLFGQYVAEVFINLR